MKVSKMPGFGSFGAIVEDFEWDQPEAYDQLRELNLKSLVTVVKGNGVNNFNHLASHSSGLLSRRPSKFALKYNTKNFRNLLTEHERVNGSIHINTVLGPEFPGWHRVTGKTTEDNKPMGIFGDTELDWHSNEFMTYDFQPLVLLYGISDMTGSATSFIQTADWYDSQTESFKSELNELISICDFDPRKVIPNGRDIDLELVKLSNPNQNNFRKPLVLDSVGGIRGINYSHFIKGFEGLSQEDGNKIIKKIRTELIDAGNEYDYWWDHDVGDLLVFDNTICVHMRKIKEEINMVEKLHRRVGYRLTGDYTDHIQWNGFLQQEFRDYRQETINKLLDPYWK
jgi:alpha-ketoglutarate-dependent taurine dioxygenase